MSYEIPQEWFNKYLEKSGDDGFLNTTYSHSCDKGFATWEINADYLMICQVFGDGLFWLEFFKKIAKDLDIVIRFHTARNPKAWERKFGAKIVGYIMEINDG